MSILFKKTFISLAVLAVVVWSTGLSAYAEDLVEADLKVADQLVTICHNTGNGTEEIAIAAEAVDQHLAEHGDSLGACPPPPPVEVLHGEWCSALLGIFQSPMDNNQVIDLSVNPDLSDVSVMATWYDQGDNTACRARFDGTFDQSNYLNIDWCAGLVQGVQDTLGSQRGDAKYSEMFNLVNSTEYDGVINLSDVSEAVRLNTAGDQAACYAYYVPPMPQWPVEPEPTTTRSQWCSALKGMAESTLQDNQVINADDQGAVNMVDAGMIATWYADHNDNACYGRFDLGDGQYNFNQENYTNIDWCAGLKQGIMDYMGTSTTTAEFSTIFDLNHDGKINLSDTPILASLLAAGDQAACYTYYVPPMPQWSVDPEICESVAHAVTYNPYPTCGAATCEEGYEAVEGVCVANENPTCTNVVEHATSYSAYPECRATACESGYVLSGGSCIAENRSSGGGGGGGGGIAAFNIFNVQNSVLNNSATITWQTNRMSLTWMLYGTSTSYGSEYQGANYHTAHTLDLTSLLPGTVYHYQIRAKDANNNTVYDIDRTFTTPGVLPQVLGVKENVCKPDVDGDIKGVMKFIAGSLIRGCGPEVYHVLGNNVYHIPSWQYLHDNYFAQRIYNVTDEVIAQYGQTMVDDTTVRGNSTQKVLGAKLYPDGTLLRAKDGKIYVIVNGKKVHIISLEELKKYAGHKMYNVSDAVLNQY